MIDVAVADVDHAGAAEALTTRIGGFRVHTQHRVQCGLISGDIDDLTGASQLDAEGTSIDDRCGGEALGVHFHTGLVAHTCCDQVHHRDRTATVDRITAADIRREKIGRGG